VSLTLRVQKSDASGETISKLCDLLGSETEVSITPPGDTQLDLAAAED
jgi:hypothetical protein